jgi:hypothetical protein
MSNIEQNDQLEKEAHLGEKAAKAYSLWVMHYITKHRQMLFDNFYEADFEEYPYIHAEISALYNLESAIQNDITTGDLARKQLKGE